MTRKELIENGTHQEIAEMFLDLQRDSREQYWLNVARKNGIVEKALNMPHYPLTKEEIKGKSVTYGTVEAMLKASGFDVKYLVRDIRGDWGDDGGYLVSIAERSGLFYTHFIEINYNADISNIIFDENDFINYNYGVECVRDFKTHLTLEDALDFTRNVADIAKELYYDEDYESGDEDVRVFAIMISDTSAFWEDAKINYSLIKHIDSTRYIASYQEMGFNVYEGMYMYEGDDFIIIPI